MPPLDPLASFSVADDAYSNAMVVTPDDDNDLPVIPSAIWCQPGSQIRMTFSNGETVNVYSLHGGLLRVRPVRIHETGTSIPNFADPGDPVFSTPAIVMFW